MKRVFESMVALVGLICALPFFIVLIPLIRLTSSGKAIFAQERVGKGKEVFTCYKLRTMAKDTKQAGTHEVSSSSVTPVGSVLRKLKLDELPQLWNVFVGDMSFVGPRPCLPVQTELIEEREKRGVYEILPGITGLGQVRGIDMSDPVRLAECDAEYVRSRSLVADLKLLWLTVWGAGRGDRVKVA
ncbi:MAG: lipid carrier--UDP-N-acetylgalactosaminyltransferase [Verrucomicrobiales bacterium]|nr:lipid carrier--UDP-N-acetylgalactosaminyltransferase [Verrucomicrobiales bacterium]